MYVLEKTVEFDKWLRKLNDLKAKAAILLRLQRVENYGHFGDCKSVGDGISEMRLNISKGYRIYYKLVGDKMILLLVGGDKSSQTADIEKAKLIGSKIKNDGNYKI
jgi:putative addiction module killer protein